MEKIYKEMEQRQKDRVAAMRQQAQQGSVADKVKQVLHGPPGLALHSFLTSFLTSQKDAFDPLSKLSSQAWAHTLCKDAGTGGAVKISWVCNLVNISWATRASWYPLMVLGRISLLVKSALSSPLLTYVVPMQAVSITLGMVAADVGNINESFHPHDSKLLDRPK
jgi:hypothetical protein